MHENIRTEGGKPNKIQGVSHKLWNEHKMIENRFSPDTTKEPGQSEVTEE